MSIKDKPEDECKEDERVISEKEEVKVSVGFGNENGMGPGFELQCNI